MENPNSLEDRMEALENRLKRIEKAILLQQTDKQQADFEIESVSRHEDDTEEERYVASQGPNPVVEWLKEDWLMKLGAFLLLLALGWFVTYAFVNNWIGPMGRIAIGVLAGAGIMLGGHFAISKKRTPGLVLVVLGGVMILLTLFAARSYYDFFTPASALIMMSVVVVAMAVLAIMHDAKSVAILALLGGAAVPILVSSGTQNYLALMSYILVLNIGTLVVAVMKGWRSMITLGLIITGLYSLAAFSGLERQESVAVVWAFMGLYFAFFFISTISAIIKTRKAEGSDLITSAINGLLLLYWIYEFVPRESASLVLSGIVLLLAGISYVLVKIKDLESALYIHAGLGILFLGAATAFELKGDMLTIAFAIESFIIVALSAYALKDSRLAQVISATQLIPMVMALPSIIDKNWEKGPLFSENFFVLLIVIISLAGTALILNQKRTSEHEASLPGVAGGIAGIFTIVLIWLSCHNIFDSVNVSRGVALVIYSLAGVSALFYGTYLQKKTQRIIGGVLLGGVVLRLLFVEVWSMSLAGKIITFVAIGVLLVSTAFFQKRISHSNQ